MRSPFAMFRKHQRMLMVVTIGLSLFAFVICGGVGSAQDMPQSLVAVAIVCMCGGIAWLMGVPTKKSSETSILGLIIGVALAVVMIRTSGPPIAVRAESGDISRDELGDLRHRRQLANTFVTQAILRTRDEEQLRSRNERLDDLVRQYLFGGLDGNVNSDRDIVTAELLRREATQLGLFVPQQAVLDYVNQITDNGMTPEIFKELRQNLDLSESQLFDILASELQARMAAEFLYDYDYEQLSRLSPTLPPEQYWQFYRQMWLQQSAEIVVIPVAEFVDESMEPPPDALQALFNEYRDNYPNFTKSGLLEEGRFGFMQPRKVEVAFLEVVFDDVHETVADATDEEIEAYYQENHVRPAEERAAAAAAAAEAEMPDDDGPLLPELQLDTPDSPDADSPERGSAETPASSDETSNSDASDADAAPADSPSTPGGDEGAAADSSQQPEPGSAGIPGAFPGETHFVAFQQDPPDDAAPDERPGDAADPSASDAADDETAAGTEPEDSESASTAPEGDSPTESDDEAAESEPAVPDTTVPPLTEALREQIRSEIQRERTIEKMERIAAEALQAVSDLGYRMSLPEDNPEYLESAEMSTELARYAEEHGLYFGTTPRLSIEDLRESEEYPVGAAFVEGRGTVADALSQTAPKDLYRPDLAEGLDTDSRFVFWKVADYEAEAPESLDDDGVRDQVAEAWRMQQARASARNRAEELLTLIGGAEGDLESGLGGQTVTGDPDDNALVVVPTGEFRWLSDPNAPRPDPYFYFPRIRDPNGVTNVGPEFMETVFNELSPGEVGIASNFDKSELYLVKILERTPSGEEEEEQFRKQFLAQPVFEEFLPGFGTVYQRLATETVSRYRITWVEQLWDKHAAQLLVAAN